MFCRDGKRLLDESICERKIKTFVKHYYASPLLMHVQLVVQQVKKRKENSAMSDDGMIRRVYKAKREDQIQIRVKKNRGQGPGASLPPVEEEATNAEENEEELERKAVIDREKVKAKQREYVSHYAD